MYHFQPDRLEIIEPAHSEGGFVWLVRHWGAARALLYHQSAAFVHDMELAEGPLMPHHDQNLPVQFMDLLLDNGDDQSSAWISWLFSCTPALIHLTFSVQRSPSLSHLTHVRHMVLTVQHRSAQFTAAIPQLRGLETLLLCRPWYDELEDVLQLP